VSNRSYLAGRFTLLLAVFAIQGVFAGCARTRDTVEHRYVMPPPLDTLREDFDAKVRCNEIVPSTENGENHTHVEEQSACPIRRTFVTTIEETGRDDTPAGELSKQILNSPKKDIWIDALLHYSIELKLAVTKIQYVASSGRVPVYDGSDNNLISSVQSAVMQDLMYTRVPAFVGGQIDENWLNSRALEFASVSRRVNAYAAAAEVDSLSISEHGEQLRGPKALQAATDSLFQAMRHGTDRTTTAIALATTPEFSEETIRIENDVIATGRIKRQASQSSTSTTPVHKQR
jgi:hypothetical protein